MKPWITYSLVRIGMFAVVLAVLILVGVTSWLAAIIAAIISLCVSYLFFGKLRESVATDLHNRRSAQSSSTAEDAAEDGPAA